MQYSPRRDREGRGAVENESADTAKKAKSMPAATLNDEDDITFRALCYLGAWDRGLPIQNGLAFESLLRSLKLNYSVQSLARVDAFLDVLRKGAKIREENYLDSPANQNLLFLLAFYTGEVIGRSLGHAPRWFGPGAAPSMEPGANTAFEASLVLAFPDAPGQANKTFLPLVAITSRLFSEFVEKSVLFSAGFFLPPSASEGPEAKLPLPAPPPAAWPVDVAGAVRNASPSQRSALGVIPPLWALTDDLRFVFDSAPALLSEGRVVWGAIVQVNNLMLQPGPLEGAPGEVLYDPQGRMPKSDLYDLARSLFALKGQPASKADLGRISKYLANELVRVFGLDVPESICPYPLKISSTWFERGHLPDRMISQPFVPLLISDAYPGAALPLPAALWPGALLAA